MDNKDKETEGVLESNSAKRLKMLGDDISEDIHLESDKTVKGDFWANVWYRNKWAIIFGAIAVVLVVILCFTLCGREKTDIKIMYVGPEKLHSEDNDASALSSKFSLLCEDYDGNGEISLSVPSITCQGDKKRAELEQNEPNKVLSDKANKENLQQFETQIMTGEFVIYLIDAELYELKAKIASVKMSEVLGYEPSTEIKYDDKAIYFSKTAFAQHFTEFEALPEDTLLCVVRTETTDKELFENSCDYVKKIIEFK